jgi:hypothetical protein
MNEKKIIGEYTKALAKHGSQRRACLAIGVPRTTMQGILDRWAGSTTTQTKEEAKPTFGMMLPHREKTIQTKSGEVRRFIFSAAQDDSAVHEPFLRNLEAYASHLGAEIMIGGFTYNKSLFEDHSKHVGWYHPSIQKYLVHAPIVINDGLVFCGEMNTLPTAVNPLSGFEVYTRHRSGIFPHAKVRLESIPTMKGFPPKMNMTTGAVTMPNYVKKRAGIIAEFHHIVGAVLVEVDHEGDWFARHLIAENDGDFQDLDFYVSNGVVDTGYAVEAINWGDVHYPATDAEVAVNGWGSFDVGGKFSAGGIMLDDLNPNYQFIHDVSDFRERNHHETKDPHGNFRKWWRGEEDIRDTFRSMATFLESFKRPGSQVVIVESNHDRAFNRWLKEADWKSDPINAELYLESNLRLLQAIKGEEQGFNALEWALKREGADIEDVRFLNEDDSFRICWDTDSDDTGIECGMHGHLGANGSKGTPRQFTKMGPKANTGHTHSASIMDGIYTAGTSSRLSMGYNSGLSSWSHSHIVTYPNGRRTIVTMKDGKWRA